MGLCVYLLPFLSLLASDPVTSGVTQGVLLPYTISRYGLPSN